MNGPDAPIGVFDSGVGGLAVLWELQRRLPHEDLLYFADQAYFPYGERTEQDVRRLTIAAAEYLAGQGCKLIVVACNTASSAALSELRRRLSMPIVGIEPAIKPACTLTRLGKVGVLATSGTVQGERLCALIDQVAGDVEVYVAAAGSLVELVESGRAGSPEAADVLDAALSPLRRAGVDVVVLGCTHYAFLKQAVQVYMGAGVTVIEPAEAVARRAVSVLSEHSLAASGPHPGRITYRSSAGEAHILAAVDMFRGTSLAGAAVATDRANAAAAGGGAG